MNAFFRMDFAGRASSGAGGIAFANGKIAGLNVGGGVYKGTYSASPTGEIQGNVTVSFPQGGQLVTGANAARGHSFQVQINAKPDPNGDFSFVAQTPTGSATVRLSKVAAL